MREFLFAFLGSFFPAVLFNIERKNLMWAGLSGALGWTAYSLLLKATNGYVFATFFGAAVVSLYSEIMARILKTPASVFSITGIFPLVPGISAYYTVQYIVEDNLMAAFNKLVDTIANAGAIAFGIMLISTVFQFYTKWKER